LSLARALIHDPPILLLDEPFEGLDADAERWLTGLLQELRGQGRTLCFVLHDEAKVRQLADRVLHLECGNLLPLSGRFAAFGEKSSVPPEMKREHAA
jgi:ABC-2 type transport system ATP-binding protein